MTADREEHPLAAVVESAPNAMVMIDVEGSIVLVNAQAEGLFGYGRDELIGRPIEVLVPEQFRATHPGRVSGFFAEPRPRVLGAGRDLYGVRKDGVEVPIEIGLHPMATDDGQVALATIIDITERKSLQAQFQHAQKMEAVGRLAGGVAHDFNNLLTVINAYGEMILARLAPDDPAHVWTTEVCKAGMRAAELTHQLLAFSRHQMLDTRALDLNAVVEDTATLLRRLVGEDVRLETSFDPSLGCVIADAGQIGQILANLAVNARDAMPRGGRLMIETGNIELDDAYCASHAEARPGRHVMIAVSDTGAGMDEATRSRVFEPFFTTKGVGKGTGLGLSTVHGIVKQSGGHVELYSELGRGTTFKVYLPRVDRAPETSPALPDGATPSGGVETVLVAEDDDLIRALVRRVLEEAGYTVIAARDGDEGEWMCREHVGPIHLLVTDLVMPLVDGPELARRFVAARPGTRVLFMSGYTDEAMLRHGRLSPGAHYLAKPFTRDTLLRKVRNVLDHGQGGVS